MLSQKEDCLTNFGKQGMVVSNKELFILCLHLGHQNLKLVDQQRKKDSFFEIQICIILLIKSLKMTKQSFLCFIKYLLLEWQFMLLKIPQLFFSNSNQLIRICQYECFMQRNQLWQLLFLPNIKFVLFYIQLMVIIILILVLMECVS
ncbi:unnamed protein product [Paramecium pentaurelia]|uniref:Transmembrane protein n=1 Tax=Paramecium pentaurelia TaxID=43138 RepID=A0A8S1UCT7_9CILI|nr:unnamed protein product [Paramecium pentaurelia]